MTTADPRDPQPTADDLRRFASNFRDEVDGAALYRVMAEVEKNQGLAEVYRRLAETEERHRDLWAGLLSGAGASVPKSRPSWRVRLLGFAAKRFGTTTILPIVQRMEADATTMYDDQPEAVAAGLPADERSHARVFGAIARSPRRSLTPTDIPLIEGRHRTASGNALRAAVLGANDGLVSNLSLVMAFAGADPGRSVVILAGVGGLLAGAISMALGEWISVRSSAEAYERQVAIERDELIHIPDEEREELALIYESKGASPEEAARLAERAMADTETALETMVSEELGLSADTGDPWVAAVVSFLMFASGALMPVLPWFFIGGIPAVVASAVLSGSGLYAMGAAITLFTGRSALYSGGRMLLFGLVAATITFLIGLSIGVGAGIS